MSCIIVGKRCKAIVLNNVPNADVFPGVLYMLTVAGWSISKRGSHAKRWVPIHIRHVPKHYRATALVMS